MPDSKQKNTELVEKLEFYQPGVKEFRRILNSCLSENQTNSLLNPMDYNNLLFEMDTIWKHSGKNPKDFKILVNKLIEFVSRKYQIDPDVTEKATLKINESPKQLEKLAEEIDKEFPPEQTNDPSNHYLNNDPNDFLEDIRNHTEDAVKEIYKRFKKSPVGEKITTFEESAPTIATTPTSTAVGLTVTGGIVGGVVTTNKITALAALPGSPVGNISQTINYGKGFVGFSITNNAELVSQLSNPAVFGNYFSTGILKLVPQSAVTQTFGFAPQPGTTYVAVTPKYFRFFNSSPKSLGSVMEGITTRPGVTMVASGGKTITSTATSATTKALGTGVGVKTGTAISPFTGPLIGAAVGFVLSKAPEIWRWMKENIGPVLGVSVFAGFFVAGVPIPLALAGGAATTVTTTILGNAAGNTGVSSFATNLNTIFNSLAGDIASTAVKSILFTILSLPIIVAFFLIIINSGAYIVPPHMVGLGGAYPTCWPVEGIITQGPAGNTGVCRNNAGQIATCTHANPNSQVGNSIDIGAPFGTPIYATHDGNAETISGSTGYGNHIIITSLDGTFATLYGHMTSFNISSGPVSAGTLIGFVGSTGFSTGPHLHYEFRHIPQTPGVIDIDNIVPPYGLGGSTTGCFARDSGGSAAP